MAIARVSSPMPPASHGGDVSGISRREFLNFVWGASVALLGVEACGAATWFALPHKPYFVPYSLWSGLYEYAAKDLPLPGKMPIFNGLGKFWLANSTQGLLALSMFCPREGCFYKWFPPLSHFVCPCCASRFALDGHKIIGTGPARRDLDRYVIHVNTSHGTVDTPTDGGPISVTVATSVIVDTRKKILGKPVAGIFATPTPEG
jgi:hypothetical protein